MAYKYYLHYIPHIYKEKNIVEGFQLSMIKVQLNVSQMSKQQCHQSSTN